MALESIEAKELTVKDVIDEAKKEEARLNEEIDYKLPDEIWGYEIATSYAWFLKPSEKWFAIILSRGEYGIDDVNDAIIVKYENWKLTIRNTVEEPYSDEMFDEIQLDPAEKSEDPNINKINKYIKTLWYAPLTNTNWDINKLWAAIDSLKK